MELPTRRTYILSGAFLPVRRIQYSLMHGKVAPCQLDLLRQDTYGFRTRHRQVPRPSSCSLPQCLRKLPDRHSWLMMMEGTIRSPPSLFLFYRSIQRRSLFSFSCTILQYQQYLVQLVCAEKGLRCTFDIVYRYARACGIYKCIEFAHVVERVEIQVVGNKDSC